MRRLLSSLTGNVKKKVNAPDEEKVTPLHYAARYNYQPLCKLLVEAGAGAYIFTSGLKLPVCHFRCESLHTVMQRRQCSEAKASTAGPL